MDKAYIIIFYDQHPPSSVQKQQIVRKYSAQTNQPVELLNIVKVDGTIPLYPNDYVISTCHFNCAQNNIPVNPEADQIELKSDMGLGIATIKVSSQEKREYDVDVYCNVILKHFGSELMEYYDKLMNASLGESINIRLHNKVIKLVVNQWLKDWMVYIKLTLPVSSGGYGLNSKEISKMKTGDNIKKMELTEKIVEFAKDNLIEQLPIIKILPQKNCK